MTQLATSIANISFDSLIFNASGPRCTDWDELQGLAQSASGAVMMKSCTKEAREGNPEPRYARLDMGAIQAMGLPNLGYQQYVQFSHDLKSYGKPVIASLAGLCLDDNQVMLEAFQQSAADLIELNLSCPNIPGKPQTGYDFEATHRTLRHLMQLTDIPMGVKLPPYFDMAHFDDMAAILLDAKVAFVSCINSLGNTLVIDWDKEMAILKAKEGFGGLSGACIKPVGLANVRAFYQRFDGKIPVIGVGGIRTGYDIVEYLLAGASAVQIGTTYEIEGTDCFQRLTSELTEVLNAKGYAQATQLIGQLKPYTA